jgi:molecular chaperone DnaK (HSP70)
MGLNPTDSRATVELSKFKCKTTFKDDHLFLQVKEKEYTTEEVSSLILKKLKEIGENYGGKSDSEVVLAGLILKILI